MILARVVGRSWSTVKHPAYEGHIVFSVAPVSASGERTGSAFLAVDTVGACPGQMVLVIREGSSSRQILGQPDAPFHSVVVGVVDAVHPSNDASRPEEAP